MEENKKSNYKGFKVFIISFLVLSMILLKKENQNKIINILDSIGGKEKFLKLTDSFENNGDILDINIYDGVIVKWENNKLSFLKSDGTLILKKEFNFTNPSIYYGDKYTYIMDKSSGDIYSLDKKGDTINRLQLNKEVFNLKESYQNLIYHIKNLDVESINILDKDKVLIGNYSYENKNILTYSTNKDGTKNILSLLDLNENTLKSQLDIYGEKNQKLSSIDVVGEIVVYLEFTAKDEILALSDRSLYFIKDGKIMWKKQFDLIKDIYLREDSVYILYSSYLEYIDFDGRTEGKISFAEDYKKILPFEEKILLYGDNNIVIVDGDKQILKHNENIIRVLTHKDQIIVWGSDEIKTYKLSSKK